MVFSSIPFLFFFFPLCLLLYYTVPFKAKNVILLIFSLIFYSWGEPVYIFLMIFTSLVNYFSGLIIEKANKKSLKKLTLVFCIVINLGLLGFFKYSNFFIEQINFITHANIKLLDVALPIGISFYTFQNLSYSIDVYRNSYKAEKNLLIYMAYITMFPQLIAGPIVRFSTVRSELHSRQINFTRISNGVMRFMTGLFKKVLIADSIAVLWDSIRQQGLSDGVSVVTAWLGAAAFTLQLYFDFSAYSDMAIGMGEMLGFRFLENFDYPLCAVSVTDFWRRWHISLSSWFRDYVYIPLGGNRRGKARSTLNILIVWALTGFWHGAAWNFMFWGIYYGILLILEKNIWGKFLEKAPKFVGHIYTLIIVVFGFTIFYFDNTSELFSYIKLMFSFGKTSFADTDFLRYISNHAVILIAACVFAAPVARVLKEKLLNSEKEVVRKVSSAICTVVFIGLFVLSVSYIVNSSYSPFLYFRF